MINTDTRQLRKNSEGYYTSGAGRIPCDHCGHSGSCPAKPVKACTEFMPAIPFTDDTGLGHISNTVRVGQAWVGRLRIGQIVALYNTKTKEIFGHARVIYTVSGHIVPMLEEHAHANHIMLETPRDEAGAKLLRWLRGNYGPHIVNTRTKITAIYLLRERVTPDAPCFLETDEGGKVKSLPESSREDHGAAERQASDGRGAKG